ncbi:ABC transporter substrate-binding protein [Umezawaea sp. NPDC059074]|uniref:ABC transporter substrate-binding protein n=1 Tax=Umezawaea sp. NPDC059074 TaxID=3346716 RepID=UPI0036B42189
MGQRRHRLLAVAAAALLGLVAACGTTAEKTTGPAELTFWTFLDNSAEVGMWNQDHPDVRVKAEKVPAQDYYAKLQAAVKAGNAPDVALVEYQFVPSMIACGCLADLKGKVRDDLGDHFPEWVWNQVAQQGGVYGVPQDIAPMGLFYRTDVFAQYGLKVPVTWAEYAEQAKKLHEADPEKYLATFATNEAGQWAGLAWQAGARWFGTEGDKWTVSMNPPQSRPVAELWQDLVAKKHVKAEPDFSTGWVSDLTSGTVASWVAPVWAGSYLKGSMAASAGKWAVAPMPQWDPAKPAVGNWGGSAISVTSGSKHVDAAAGFVQWLNTDQRSVNSLITKSSIFPADKAGLLDQSFSKPQEFYGGQKVYEVFAEAAKQVDPDFAWGPTMTTAFPAFTDEFGKVANGEQTVSQALDRLQQRTVEDMGKQGFQVRTSP